MIIFFRKIETNLKLTSKKLSRRQTHSPLSLINARHVWTCHIDRNVNGLANF